MTTWGGATKKFPRRPVTLRSPNDHPFDVILSELTANFTTNYLQSGHRTAIKMSEGEVDVAAVSQYEVLPKEVLAEVGSVKLFSMFSTVLRKVHMGVVMLTLRPQTAGATRMSRSGISL